MAVGTYIFNVVLFSIIIAVCFTNPGEASTCSPEHHKCEISTDKCIPKKWVCDGERDCNSGSDELSCPNKTCTDKQFMCKTSRMCIAEAWRCDGQSDCIDKSDEANCHNKTCTEDEFMCKTDQSCISKTWKCDGQNDCADGSDEISCSLNKTCPDEGFLCKTNQKCIHKNWRCDGDRDCVDGSDELNCSNTTCAADQFMCQTSKKCMPKRWLCDGESDCQDGSDEINCNVTTATCSPKEFMCESKPTHCILKAWACDGDPDCPDGSDEKNCSQIVCSSNEFQCKNRMACVLLSFVCNGNADCKDGSDEWNCTKVVTCSENQFKCDNETCVDAAMRCDGTKDCFNGRDETGCQPEVTEVLLADRNSLKMVTLYGNYKKAVSRRISHSGTQHAMVGVDYDYDDDLVFWTDNSQSSIFCARFLNASSSVTDERVVQDSNIDIPDGIAVDWVNNLIYWTDTGRNEISVSNYNATMRKVLVSEDLDEPRAIVVNPFTGWMYWTDWGSQAKIDRAGMDGQQRSTIVSTNLQWPNGITIDSYDDRLYWIDAKTNTVESSLTDGSDRRVISSGVIGHGFAVTTSEFNIYITSWRDRGVIGVSKVDGHVTNYINEMSDSIVQPMGVKVYNKAMQRQKTSICYTNEFECEYLCLPRPSNTKQRSTNVKYTCACPDGRTCHTSTTEPEVKSTSTTVTSPTSTPDVLTNVTMSISTSTPISVTSSTVDLSSTSSSSLTSECAEGYFKCTNAECIPTSWVCDGETDCRTGEDEDNCKHRCQVSEFRCQSDNACITKHWVCDGKYDCYDGSDEYMCRTSTAVPQVWSTNPLYDGFFFNSLLK
ncbi:very low-density lipoprotein receptor-like isoform X1 [Argopecten irradians]|uniref:very low-density lipoprotein receptor-like isoform X1 n=2 Tax=Argopecten irradians TaxID=31199 RepID=UPI003720C02E